MLLIDAGNSRIKWARLRAGQISAHGAAAHGDGLPAALLRDAAGPVYISSVAGGDFDLALQQFLDNAGVAPCHFAAVLPDRFGLRLAYRNPAKLGVDRWLAMLGRSAVSTGAVCIADAGTALTIDAVDARGQHLGGLIAPGTTTMMRSMLKDTARIGEAGSVTSLTDGAFFAADTGAAVAAGAAFAAASLIDRAVRIQVARLDEPVSLLLTGGEAQALSPLVETGHTIIPDLVLQGLARLAAESSP